MILAARRRADESRDGAIAIRSVLRLVDQLPVSYASGLISLVRTGPSRRQRIGDVAAGTMVIAAEGRSADRGTAGWVLPAATLASVAVSFLFLYWATTAGTEPLSSTESAGWVSGCNQSTGGAIDCQCALTRLEAGGYNTLNALRDLENKAREEQFTETGGAELTTLRAALLGCRRS